MNLCEILNSIPQVKKEDLQNNLITLEDICNMHPFLTMETPLTYMIFLDKRKDLSTEDRNCVFKIIKRLQDNKTIKYNQEMEERNIADRELKQANHNLEAIATSLEDLSHDSDLEIELESDSDLDLI